LTVLLVAFEVGVAVLVVLIGQRPRLRPRAPTA